MTTRRCKSGLEVKKEQPTLLIGSPMCTAFSAWQHINIGKRDPVAIAKEGTLPLYASFMSIRSNRVVPSCTNIHPKPRFGARILLSDYAT